ncbi:MAG: hypothetical protein ACK4ON_02240, partial [Bacteroidia bacterium]
EQLKIDMCMPPFYLVTISSQNETNDYQLTVYKNLDLQIAKPNSLVTYQTKRQLIRQRATNTLIDASFSKTFFEYQNATLLPDGTEFYNSVIIAEQDKFCDDTAKPYGYTRLSYTTRGIQKEVYDAENRLLTSSTSNSDDEIAKDIFATNQITSSPATKIVGSSLLTSDLLSEQGLILAQVENALFEMQEADFIAFSSQETHRWQIIQDTSATPEWPVWNIKNGIIEQGYGWSGTDYLTLQPNGLIENFFTPNQWENQYQLSTWIRLTNPHSLCNQPILRLLLLNQAGTVIYSTFGGIYAQSAEGWYYLEAKIELWQLKEAMPDETFTIHVIIQAPEQQAISVDNIQFFPVGSLFKAFRYDPILELPIVLLESNGQQTRMIYNKNGDLIATVTYPDLIQSVQSKWNALQNFSHPQAIVDTIPTTVTFEPSDGKLESWHPELLPTRWLYDKARWQFKPGCLSHDSTATDKITYLDCSNKTAISCSFQISSWNKDSKLAVAIGLHQVNFVDYSHGLYDSQPAILVAGDETIQIHALGNYIAVWVNGQIVKDFYQDAANLLLSSPNFSYEL